MDHFKESKRKRMWGVNVRGGDVNAELVISLLISLHLHVRIIKRNSKCRHVTGN